MSNTIIDTNFNFPNQKNIYKGKVREVYNIDGNQLVMIATDRLSAFDLVMPKGIPFKGQILNQIATQMMKATEDLVPNWLVATPDPNVAMNHPPPGLTTGQHATPQHMHAPLPVLAGMTSPHVVP